MNISIQKLYTILFFIGIFFLPFNSFEGLLPIGEFKQETCFYFFFAGFILLLFDFKNLPSILPPIKFLYPIIFFIAWCLASTLLNFKEIENNYFKQTSGINRFLRQFSVLFFSIFLFLIYYWNVIKLFTLQNFLVRIRSIFLCTLLFCSVIGFFQILIISFNFNTFKNIINLFEYLPFVNIKFFADSNRISTVSFEPPFLAIYLISIFGWMLSYLITSKKWWKGIPTILILLLTYFSGSRTGMIIISFQLIMFILILCILPIYRKFLFSTLLSIIFSITIIFSTDLLSTKIKSSATIPIVTQEEKISNNKQKSLERIQSLDFKNNLNTSISNKTRFGMQFASIQVFKDHPLIGVGFGQQTYYSRKHYPKWATENNYEFTEWYNNENIKSFPPGYNIYTRILAELGIIGLLLFLSIILFCLYFSIKLINKKDTKYTILGICLFISFIGLSINWLQIDSFRIFSFWIYTAILIFTLNNIKITK